MRILLTGNLFHSYEFDLKAALEELGHKVDLKFNNLHGPYNLHDVKTIPDWFMYGFLPYKLKVGYFFSRSVNKYNTSLQRLIKDNNYNILLVIGGRTISNETINSFKGIKVLWFLDSIQRYEDVFIKVPLFDEVFFFEPTDIIKIKERFGKQSYFLPPGFNPHIYYPRSQESKYDFSFIGSYYPKREQYLQRLSEVSDNLCIYGDFFRAQGKTLRKKVKKVSIPRHLTNDLYNSTKVNINIHHYQSREGLSPRTFEILGAGGFQLVERQKVAVEFFEEDRDIAFYESEDEFVDKARFYLQSDSLRDKIALNGYEKAIKLHTWKQRFNEMFLRLNDYA